MSSSVPSTKRVDSASMLEALLDTLPTGAAIVRDGRILYVNRAFCELSGYERDEIETVPALSVVEAAERTTVLEHYAKLVEGRLDFAEVRVRIITKQGARRWVTLGGRRVRFGDDLAVLGFAHDVTELVEASQAAASSEHRFRLLAEHTPVAIFLHRGATMTYANPAAASFSGYSVEELQQMSFWATVHPDYREMVRERGIARKHGDQPPSPYEIKIVRKSGDERWLDIMGTPVVIDDEPHVLGTGVDVTQRKLAEQALRESEEMYRSLVETSPDAIIVAEPDGVVRMANQRAAQMLGFADAGVLLGINGLDLVAPEDRAAVRESARRVVERGGLRNVEHRFLRRDGTGFFGEVNASVIRSSGGRTRAFVAVIRDVTRRKLDNAALRQAAREKALILDAISEHVIYVDTTCRVIWANRAGTQWLAQKQDDQGALFCFHGASREDPCPGCPVLAAEVSGQPASAEINDKSGRTRAVVAYPVGEESERPEGFVVVSEDVTDQRRVENELLRAQKLESIGVLAGGIAHDFNNILTAILGNVCLAKRADPNLDGKASSALEAAQTAVKRAQGLTQQLLTFSKGGAPIKRLLSLPALLAETASLVLSGTNVRATIAVEDDLWPVEADEGQIAQVISNLLINAVQAMPGGGVVRLRASNAYHQQPGAAYLAQGRYVCFAIEDAGEGIPEEHLGKLFDPYFTTKSGGTGLGLSTSYAILQKHGGGIQVESKLGRGSVFTVYLPAASGSRDPTSPPSSHPPAAQGRVLVMDDEPMVRQVAMAMLSESGFDVDTANDGQEAIAHFTRARGEGRPYDAIIMDITVPGGMGGLEAMQRIREIDPAVRAVVSSGYSNAPVMSSYRDHGFAGVVSKPYTPQQIVDAVRSVLKSGE